MTQTWDKPLVRPGSVESTFTFLFCLVPTSELHVFFQLLQLIAYQEKKIPSCLPCSQVKGSELLFSCVFLGWMISAVLAGCRGGGCFCRGLFSKKQGSRWPAATCMGLPLLPVRFTQLCTPRACILLRLPRCMAFVCWDLSGRLRLEEGLIFPGFDVLIPQRNCLLRLRSAAASRLRFLHLPLRCHICLRPWLDEETCCRLTSPSQLRGALTAPLGTAGACGAGAAALRLGCLPQSLASLNAWR